MCISFFFYSKSEQIIMRDNAFTCRMYCIHVLHSVGMWCLKVSSSVVAFPVTMTKKTIEISLHALFLFVNILYLDRIGFFFAALLLFFRITSNGKLKIFSCSVFDVIVFYCLLVDHFCCCRHFWWILFHFFIE